MKSQKSKKNKQPYEKPKVKRIGLVAEEVLSVGCKLDTAAGPFGGTCLAVPCNQVGS